jgi:cation:H+ antiporter
MLNDILYFISGSLLLYYGADYFILGSRALASKFSISPIIIGITLVALGTSLPELIVSIVAIFNDGAEGIIIGNVVGSNIANIGLVLAISALIAPLAFKFIKIKIDLYFLLFLNFLLLIFIFFGDLVFWQGIILLILLLIYCKYLLSKEQESESNNKIIYDSRGFLIKIIFGILGLGLGANFFILGAKGIAAALGVPPIIIGMSIVALGTSLPELAASIVAVKHGEIDFVIGNIIGSNIMNIAVVLGITLLIGPIPIEFINVKAHLFFMIIFTLLLIYLIKYKGNISKLSAIVLMFIYISFIYINFQ